MYQQLQRSLQILIQDFTLGNLPQGYNPKHMYSIFDKSIMHPLKVMITNCWLSKKKIIVTSEKENSIIIITLKTTAAKLGMCVCESARYRIYQKMVTELVSWWEIRGELFFLFFPFQISSIEEIYISISNHYSSNNPVVNIKIYRDLKCLPCIIQLLSKNLWIMQIENV